MLFVFRMRWLFSAGSVLRVLVPAGRQTAVTAGLEFRAALPLQPTTGYSQCLKCRAILRAQGAAVLIPQRVDTRGVVEDWFFLCVGFAVFSREGEQKFRWKPGEISCIVTSKRTLMEVLAMLQLATLKDRSCVLSTAYFSLPYYPR